MKLKVIFFKINMFITIYFFCVIMWNPPDVLSLNITTFFNDNQRFLSIKISIISDEIIFLYTTACVPNERSENSEKNSE